MRAFVLTVMLLAVVRPAVAQLPTNNDPSNQIRFHTAAAADAERLRLTKFIWTEGLPTGRMPAVTRNIDKGVFLGDLAGIDPSLVSRVDRLDSDVSGFDFHSISYLLLPANTAHSNRIVIVHHGHVEYEERLAFGIARTVSALLLHGFSVDLMQMPMHGWNSDHTANVPGQGTLDYDGNAAMIYKTGPPEGGMGFRLFLEPVIQNINYFETLPGLSDITMTGLSGGGWTTHMAAAIDTRIRLSIPVAGSAPLYYLNSTANIDGDENEYAPLYNENIAPDGSGGGVATFLEIFALGGYGSGRKQIMVTNQFDPCCYFGTFADAFKSIVSHTVRDLLGQGEWDYYLDSTTDAHEITQNTLLRVILPALDLPLDITTASSLPGVSLGKAYSKALTAAGGTFPYSNWTVTSGNLPPGLSLDSATGTIGGTATGNCGPFNFTARVTDGAGVTASKDFQIPVVCTLTITTSTLPWGTVTAEYVQTFAVTGGTPPYSWTVIAGSLPGGLSLNPTTAVLRGRPVGVSGTFNFTLGVHDVLGAAGLKSFQLTLQPPFSSSPLTRVGGFAQVASGGGWKTTMTLMNLSAVTVNARVNLYSDSGSPMTLPLVFPQIGLSMSASSLNLTLSPNQSFVIESEASSSSIGAGWADVQATGALSGYSIFRMRLPGVPDSEGTVPLDSGLSSSLVLPYDNTNRSVTGVALANQESIAASVTAILLDQNGVQLSSTQITLPPLAHVSFFLMDRFPQSANQLGVIRFQNASGDIIGVGLRFSSSGAFTSVPIIR